MNYFSFIPTTQEKHTQHWAEILLHDQKNEEIEERAKNPSAALNFGLSYVH